MPDATSHFATNPLRTDGTRVNHDGLTPKRLLFTWRSTGFKCSPNVCRTSRSSNAFDQTGLPRVKLHELRHTNITAALGAGVPVHVISRRVGHSKVSTTLDTYTRHIPSADDMAAETIGRLLSEPVE